MSSTLATIVLLAYVSGWISRAAWSAVIDRTARRVWTRGTPPPLPYREQRIAWEQAYERPSRASQRRDRS